MVESFSSYNAEPDIGCSTSRMENVRIPLPSSCFLSDEKLMMGISSLYVMGKVSCKFVNLKVKMRRIFSDISYLEFSNPGSGDGHAKLYYLEGMLLSRNCVLPAPSTLSFLKTTAFLFCLLVTKCRISKDSTLVSDVFSLSAFVTAGSHRTPIPRSYNQPMK